MKYVTVTFEMDLDEYAEGAAEAWEAVFDNLSAAGAQNISIDGLDD